MIGDDALAAWVVGHEARPEPLRVFECALAELAQLVMELNTTIGKLAFADGARVGGDVERALERTAVLSDALPEGPEGADALRRFHEMRSVARRQLAIAPAPSLVAIATAESGDDAQWRDEEQSWIAERLGRDSSPCIPAAHRKRPPTRPETPVAIRRVSDDMHRAAIRALTTRGENDGGEFEDHEP